MQDDLFAPGKQRAMETLTGFCVAWMSFHKRLLRTPRQTSGYKRDILLGRMGAISGESRCVEEALSHLMDTAGFEPSDGDAASGLPVTDAGHNKRQTP